MQKVRKRVRIRQLVFTDEEEGIRLGWNQTPGTDLQKCAAWHHKLAHGDMAEWIAVRRKQHSDDQIAYTDAITPAILPIQSNLPKFLSYIFWLVGGYYYRGVTCEELAHEHLMHLDELKIQFRRLTEVNLLKRIDQKTFVVPTLDVLRVRAVRTHEFGQFLIRVEKRGGPTIVDEMISEFAPIPDWAKSV